VVEGDFLGDERLAPGAISATYVEAVAVAERGAHPVALLDEYGPDERYVADYARAARTEDGFRQWLADHLPGAPAAAAPAAVAA